MCDANMLLMPCDGGWTQAAAYAGPSIGNAASTQLEEAKQRPVLIMLLLLRKLKVTSTCMFR